MEHLSADDVARAYDGWSCTYDTSENPTRDLAGEHPRPRGLVVYPPAFEEV